MNVETTPRTAAQEEGWLYSCCPTQAARGKREKTVLSPGRACGPGEVILLAALPWMRPLGLGRSPSVAERRRGSQNSSLR